MWNRKLKLTDIRIHSESIFTHAHTNTHTPVMDWSALSGLVINKKLYYNCIVTVCYKVTLIKH